MTVPAAVSGAVEVRDAAHAFARRHLVPRPEDVALAVWEACVNVVHHAYRDRPAGTIDCSGRRRGGEVLLTVADHGGGLQRNEQSPGLGAGLILIATLADACEIVTTAVGTQLGLRFRCGPDPAQARAAMRLAGERRPA